MAAAPAGPLQAILERAHRVPDLTHFPGVDEITARLDALTDEHPDLVTRRRIGTSRLGDPITMYSIGDGPDQALVYAGVHPNEPIGFWTAIHLAEDLCADADLRATCRWNIIGCIDPDGTRLNEGWFDGPFTRVHYSAHFHRPAPAEQVEWSFPFQYKNAYFDQVLPETLALMRVIDELQPIIAVSLHNTEVGGVYYYLTQEPAGLVDELHAIAASFGLPLDLGEPETPVARPIGPAVFEMISQHAMYDYAEDRGLPTPNESGSSSAAYAERHGTVSLVAELPYWTHPSADDQTPTDLPYQQVLVRCGRRARGQPGDDGRDHSGRPGRTCPTIPSWFVASRRSCPTCCGGRVGSGHGRRRSTRPGGDRLRGVRSARHRPPVPVAVRRDAPARA